MKDSGQARCKEPSELKVAAQELVDATAACQIAKWAPGNPTPGFPSTTGTLEWQRNMSAAEARVHQANDSLKQALKVA